MQASLIFRQPLECKNQNDIVQMHYSAQQMNGRALVSMNMSRVRHIIIQAAPHHVTLRPLEAPPASYIRRSCCSSMAYLRVLHPDDHQRLPCSISQHTHTYILCKLTTSSALHTADEPAAADDDADTRGWKTKSSMPINLRQNRYHGRFQLLK